MKKLKDKGGHEITTKALKGVTGFNKGDMAPLLVQFYEVTKNAMEVISSLQALELRSQAKCDELETKTESKSSDPLNSDNIRSVIKDELSKAVPTITQSVIAETDKKWSDLFKNQIKLVDTSSNPKAMCFKGKNLAKEIVAEEERQRSIIIRGLEADEIYKNYEGDPREEVEYVLSTEMNVPNLKQSIVKCAFIGKLYKPVCPAEKSPGLSAMVEKTQAVKVTFKSKDDAQEALRNRFILKDSGNIYKFVFLSPDRCASERKLLKELVQEKKRKVKEFPDKVWRISKLKLTSCDRPVEE